MTTETKVDGLFHFLVTEANGTEYVMRYTADDAAEVFKGWTPEACNALESGKTVVTASGTRWQDMVACARKMASLQAALA